MAGTNSAEMTPLTHPAPVVVLVRPQLGENIGMCARAMLNCGATELRIVAPRDGWPNPAAVSAASGAVSVIENARIFETTADAVADLTMVLATTARNRDIAKTILTAEDAGREIRRINTEAGRATCGLLFGPERTGLDNDDAALATTLVTIPLNPAFSSLNLAQAVLLLCYSWLSADNPFTGPAESDEDRSPPATQGDLENLMQQMEKELDDAGFFRSESHRPTLMRNIRNYFFRSGPTQQEVRTLHGIIAARGGRRRRG
jgi:tRNA/rRNA methyltransferase